MENIPFIPVGANLRIEGYPNAVKVIEIDDTKSRRLADLFLHKVDLEIAFTNLRLIEHHSDTQDVDPRIGDALWESSIIRFLKCFGKAKARMSLDPTEIYKGEPPEAMLAFCFFKKLRNKHVAHDENSYAQCLPGAILNAPGCSNKIEKIICLDARVVTLEQDSFDNLGKLIKKALTWVEHQFDDLDQEVILELEREPYEALVAKREVQLHVPAVEDIGKNRRKSATP